jgi:hypothetical protein
MRSAHSAGWRSIEAARDGEIVIQPPIFGALSAEYIARLEPVPGVQVSDVARGAGARRRRGVMTAGSCCAVPASVLDHVIGCTALSDPSFSAGVAGGHPRRQRELTVTNARGVFSRPIAEYVVMMCLAIARHLPELLDLQAERTWQPLRGTELGSMTVGIVGFGSIGTEVATLLQPFGTRVIATRRHPGRGADDLPNVELLPLDELDELLRRSDIVLVAAPLTEETAGMIGSDQLQEMPEHAWLINVARGRLVDELALRRALSRAGSAGRCSTSSTRSRCRPTRRSTTLPT